LLSTALGDNRELNLSSIDCNDKVVKIGYQDSSRKNYLDYEIVKKIQFKYFYIKYYLLDLWYSFIKSNKEIVITQKPFNVLDNQNLYNNDNNKTNRFIAHAAGKINNHIYTNSLEALNLNYKNGFRLFELDILKTKNNIYVAAHSWEEWKSNTKYKGSIPPTLKDFKNTKLYGQYTLLDINDINKWFCNHEDAILITDKVNEPIKFSNQFLFKKRLYMELFSLSAVLEGRNEGINIMPTWDILPIFQNRIVENLLDLNIKVIAASRDVIKNNKELLRRLKENNIRVYAFHINLDKEKDEKYTICNELDYFYGIYADKWNFNNIECEIPPPSK
jgi:hypothetical protein